MVLMFNKNTNLWHTTARSHSSQSLMVTRLAIKSPLPFPVRRRILIRKTVAPCNIYVDHLDFRVQFSFTFQNYCRAYLNISTEILTYHRYVRHPDKIILITQYFFFVRNLPVQCYCIIIIPTHIYTFIIEGVTLIKGSCTLMQTAVYRRLHSVNSIMWRRSISFVIPVFEHVIGLY